MVGDEDLRPRREKSLYGNVTVYVHRAQRSIDNSLRIGAIPSVSRYVIENDFIK